MYRRLLLLCAIVLTGAMLVACGGDDDEDNGSSGSTGTAAGDATAPAGRGSGAEPRQVEIIDFGYEPDSLTATAGEEVALQLTNSGEVAHTFTIDGVVDSMEIAAGESTEVSFTPEEPGTLTFFCTLHGAGSMSGELTVN